MLSIDVKFGAVIFSIFKLYKNFVLKILSIEFTFGIYIFFKLTSFNIWQSLNIISIDEISYNSKFIIITDPLILLNIFSTDFISLKNFISIKEIIPLTDLNILLTEAIFDISKFSKYILFLTKWKAFSIDNKFGEYIFLKRMFPEDL